MAEIQDIKRDHIVETATRLFVRDGYAATSMDKVAKAAKASKATIYARFPSKSDLFTAVMLNACSGIAAPALSDPAAYDDLEGVLRAAGQATLARVFQPRGIAVIQAAIGAKAAAPEAMRIYWENGPGWAERAVAAGIEQEQAAGRMTQVNAKAEARRFLNMVTGPFLYGVLAAGDPLPDEAAKADELERAITAFLARLT